MEMVEVISDSLKNVCKVKEILRTLIEMQVLRNDALIERAFELLDKTEEILANTYTGNKS